MAHTFFELLWLKSLLQEWKVLVEEPMRLYCDNRAASHISSNPVFHERTIHIKADFHFIRGKVALVTPYAQSQNQPADIFTKSLSSISYFSQ